MPGQKEGRDMLAVCRGHLLQMIEKRSFNPGWRGSVPSDDQGTKGQRPT